MRLGQLRRGYPYFRKAPLSEAWFMGACRTATSQAVSAQNSAESGAWRRTFCGSSGGIGQAVASVKKFAELVVCGTTKVKRSFRAKKKKVFNDKFRQRERKREINNFIERLQKKKSLRVIVKADLQTIFCLFTGKRNILLNTLSFQPFASGLLMIGTFWCRVCLRWVNRTVCRRKERRT